MNIRCLFIVLNNHNRAFFILENILIFTHSLGIRNGFYFNIYFYFSFWPKCLHVVQSFSQFSGNCLSFLFFFLLLYAVGRVMYIQSFSVCFISRLSKIWRHIERELRSSDCITACLCFLSISYDTRAAFAIHQLNYYINSVYSVVTNLISQKKKNIFSDV